MFRTIDGYITPEDFTEELFHKVATVLFEQFKEQGSVNPAQIISLFENEEEQREVAELFNATIHEVESQSDMEKAVKETMIRIKQNSINFKSSNLAPTDLQGLMKVVEAKRSLEQLEKLHISIN